MPNEAADKAVMDRFVEECINGHNLDAIDQLVAEDFVELDPLPGQGPGREGLKQTIGSLITAFPDIHWVVTERVAENGTVASRFAWEGTHRGEFFGVPATGRRITVTGMVFDRIREGRLAESRILMNTLDLLRQLGAVG